MSNYYPTAQREAAQDVHGSPFAAFVGPIPALTPGLAPQVFRGRPKVRIPFGRRLPIPARPPAVGFGRVPFDVNFRELLLAFDVGYSIGLTVFGQRAAVAQWVEWPAATGWNAYICAGNEGYSGYASGVTWTKTIGTSATNCIGNQAAAPGNGTVLRVGFWHVEPSNPARSFHIRSYVKFNTASPVTNLDIINGEVVHPAVPAQTYYKPAYDTPYPFPWVPTVAPDTLPIAVPLPELPAPVPWWVVPYLPDTVPMVPFPVAGNGVPDDDPVTDVPLPWPDPWSNPPKSPPGPVSAPGPGTKERKVRSNHPVVRLAWRAANVTTESIDVLMCAVKALPVKYRPKPQWVAGGRRPPAIFQHEMPVRGGKVKGAPRDNYRWTPKGWVREAGYYRAPTVQEDMDAIYLHADKIDLWKFFKCLAANHLEDAIIGGLASKVKPIPHRPLGPLSGPAL